MFPQMFPYFQQKSKFGNEDIYHCGDIKQENSSPLQECSPGCFLVSKAEIAQVLYDTGYVKVEGELVGYFGSSQKTASYTGLNPCTVPLFVYCTLLYKLSLWVSETRVLLCLGQTRTE